MNELQIPESIQDLMQSMLSDIYAIRDPKTRKTIRFNLPPSKNQYRYFEHKGWMFCYTPWSATNGKYYCWTYKPFGEGSRTGNPSKWKMINLIGFRKRKTAKQRAYDRYCKLKKGNGNG